MTTLEKRFIEAKRKCFNKLYANLNSKQREAVFTVKGPLLVLAGAGSGKTTVLVHRISHIIRFGDAYFDDALPEGFCEDEVEYLELMANGDVPLDAASLQRYAKEPAPPYSILAITFTNKAANSMKQKLEKLLEGNAADVWAGTFHSVCARILRREIEKIGYASDFAIYDTDDTKKLIAECEKELDISSDKFPPKAVQNLISKTKEKLIDADEFEEKAGNDFYLSHVAKIYKLYEQKLKNANALDFDDLIGKTVALFEEMPEVLEFYQRRFKYVLVDEYQDTNHSQFKLVSLLAERYKNLMVVGDDDQSIYSFRGASVENILSFDKSFRAKVIKLEQNYRSTANILGAANSLIDKNKGRYGKALWCEGEKGTLPTVALLDNQSAEVQYIADIISENVASGKAQFSDFAILYRMNAQSGGFETVFAKSAIPYRMLCGVRFYERAEVKDIVAYMQLAVNERDDTRLARIINVPKRSIGDTTVELLRKLAAAEGTYIYDIIARAGEFEALSKCRDKLYKFYDFMEKVKLYSQKLPLGEFAERLISESGYADMLLQKGEEGIERMENLKELVNNMASHAEENPDATLTGFLEEVSLIADVDNYDEKANAVTMMTVHSAKGLEFPWVFIPGMEEGIFPGARTVSESELEEERRLAYVALTRAEKELYITHARERMMYGRTNSNPPSRFIAEIADEYKNEVVKTSHRAVFSGNYGNFGYVKRETADDFKYIPPKSAKPVVLPPKPNAPAEIFKVGDAVEHKIFGKGLVVGVTSLGGDTLYEVAFDKVGTKKLMAAYAKLKRT